MKNTTRQTVTFKLGNDLVEVAILYEPNMGDCEESSWVIRATREEERYIDIEKCTDEG